MYFVFQAHYQAVLKRPPAQIISYTGCNNRPYQKASISYLFSAFLRKAPMHHETVG
jgi:hypothetical protein